MAYEVPAALIGGGAGFLTGGISALVAPWAKWGVDKRQRREDRRVALIAGWRAAIDELRLAETHTVALNAENREKGLPEVSDPPEADPVEHEWFRTLQLELSYDATERVEQLRQKPVAERRGQIPVLLHEEVLRIERDKWGLL